MKTSFANLLACFATMLLPLASNAQNRIEVKCATNVDERLFLVRVLEGLYEAWPSDTSDPKAFVEAAADLRTSAIRFREHVRRNRIDSDIENNFSEFVASLDTYTDFLANIGQIKKEALEQALKDTTEASFNAGYSGGMTYGALKSNDYSSGQAAAGALAVYGIQFIADAWQKSKVRDEAERRAVENAARKIQDHLTASLSNAQATAKRLSRMQGWQEGEAGFELSQAQADAVQSLMAKEDLNGLLRVCDNNVRNRPRDPFIRLSRNILMAISEGKQPEPLLKLARDCVDAASLVPEPAVYDDYRTQCIGCAAMIAAEARLAEILKGIRPMGATEASQFSVDCFDWLVSKNRQDTTGELREARAFQLMANNQLDAALAQANEVFTQRKTDPGFSYNYACLMSRMNDPNKSLAFLEQALSQGWWNINHAKIDPDMDAMRRAKSAEFAALAKVKTSWTINWGILNDDILLTNNSKFPITNVVLDVHLEQDGKIWEPQLKTEIIGVGETKKWVNAVSIPGGRLTKSGATVSCDQDR